MVTKKLTILFLLLFSTIIISAQPPSQLFQSQEKGLTMEAPAFDYQIYNTSYTYHLHVYNGSTGSFLTNTTVFCTFHLYDRETGLHIIEENMTYSAEDIDFQYFVLGTNFTTFGDYATLYFCQTHNLEGGGFLLNYFEVNPTGTQLTEAQSTMYWLLIAVTVFFLASSLFVFQKLPKRNMQFADGEMVSIAWLKYLRFPIGIFMYALIMAIVWLSSTMAYAYIPLSAVGPVLLSLFNIMGVGLMVAFPIGMFLIIQKAVKDLQLNYMQKRGIY